MRWSWTEMTPARIMKQKEKKYLSQAVNTLLFVISPDFRALRAALYWFAGWLVYAEMKSINPSLPDADTRMGEMPTEIESSSDSSQAHR